MSNLREKTLALAGIFQATALVKDVAVNGSVDKHDFEICIRSIFETEPENVEAVYGQVEYLRTGLMTLIDQLGENSTLEGHRYCPLCDQPATSATQAQQEHEHAGCSSQRYRAGPSTN